MTLPSALYDQRLKASHVRTRRPLSLYYTEAVPSGSQDIPDDTTVVETVAIADLKLALNGAPGSGENGYATGNASHLHLLITNDSTNETVQIFVYNYAWKGWAPLYIPVNFGGATADAAYVAAKWTCLNGTKSVIVPIYGSDRVAFIQTGEPDANYIIKAAVSTF